MRRFLGIGQKMSSRRLPIRDPRTVARDIPGIVDAIFPRIRGGLVADLNRSVTHLPDLAPIPDHMVLHSGVQPSMLFEVAVARAEQILLGVKIANWGQCLIEAAARQRKHFDAKIPEGLGAPDIDVAEWAAGNLIAMLKAASEMEGGREIECRPVIPGFGWIASGFGDFSVGNALIEVKHTDRNFVSGDFRQVLLYWLLRYASSLEGDGYAWSHFYLLNPRRNTALHLQFDYLTEVASGGLNRIDIYERLRALVGFDSDGRQ